MAEEINEALLEGIHVDKWQPGAWANTSGDDEEWQPDVEPPHITDYAVFKKHKHYGQYFKPYRYRPFPAWLYHATEEPRLVISKEEVLNLGPDWTPIPTRPRIDMTGKSHVGKSQTERLGEIIAESMAAKPNAGGIDANAIAAVVAAVMAALPRNSEPAAHHAAHTPEVEPIDVEREAMFELAEKNGIRIDKRWSNDRIRKELGL